MAGVVAYGSRKCYQSLGHTYNKAPVRQLLVVVVRLVICRIISDQVFAIIAEGSNHILFKYHHAPVAFRILSFLYPIPRSFNGAFVLLISVSCSHPLPV